MKRATRKMLATFAILAVSAVALFGSVGAAQASKGSNNGAYVSGPDPFLFGYTLNFICNKGSGCFISVESG